jgi:outer membrane protein OmpA-like peptidoglycan-associated protein
MNRTLNFSVGALCGALNSSLALMLGSGLLLGACSTQDTMKSTAPLATTTVAAATSTAIAAPVASPVALPHDEAVTSAAQKIFTNAKLPPDQRVTVVIDPLLDGVTGAQTVATAAIEKRLVALIKAEFPQVEVKPFNAANVATLPLILVGTFTPINLQGKAELERNSYRICFSLADLKTGKIISKGLAFSKLDGVDSQPLPFFSDSPVWVSDKVIEGYIKTCQGTKAGDPINPAYVDTIVAATAIDEAQQAYNEKKYKEALALYTAALKIPAGDQPRVQMGIYLSNLKLNRRDSAMQAFAKLVRSGFSSQRLAVKFNFKPGSASFAADAAIHERWLKEIAKQSAQSTGCVEVAGHSSRGGSETLNEQVSMLRAEYIKQKMEGEVKALKQRLTAQGFGSKKIMVGTGKGDQSDALDRRIEFKPTTC